MPKSKPKIMSFNLEDLELPHRKIGGEAFVENGQLFVRLNAHGNQSETLGPIMAVQLDHGIARLIVFRDINSEEPTEALDLDGALERNRS